MLLKDNQWIIIDQILPLLRTLTSATEVLCIEEFPSISGIYPLVFGLLKKQLCQNDTDSNVLNQVKTWISDGLKTRLLGTNYLQSVASVLDPRYKRLKFLNAEREQVYNYTKQLIPSADEHESATTETNIDVKVECPSPAKNPKNTSDFNSVMSFLGVDDLIDLDDNQNMCLEQEFQDYLNDKHTVEIPLHWLQSNVHRFPMLGSVVKS